MQTFDYIAKVDIEVSDPWEFGTDNGTGPFAGVLLKLFSSDAYDTDQLGVLKLDKAIDFKSTQYEYLLVQSRHVDVPVSEIKGGAKVLCNLSSISEASANTADPLTASKNDPKAAILVGSVISINTMQVNDSADGKKTALPERAR